jgi:hypothetical protein
MVALFEGAAKVAEMAFVLALIVKATAFFAPP